VFDSCGQEPGLEIWRVEDYKLNPIPKALHGSFYTGDSYLILHTSKAASGKLVFNLHFWIGSESSQDEYGAAAIIAAQMDEAKNDEPVQFREVEGVESAVMASYFEATGGIQYKCGGKASGANHVVTNEDDNKRILRVKGVRNKIKSKEVAFSWDSVTSDDVYIFEIGADLYRWRGAEANMFEWMESNKLANSIRDNEQNGRGEIISVEAGDSWPSAVIAALGPAPDSFEASGVSDKANDSDVKAKLYKVSNDSGTLEVTEVECEGKPAKDVLETDDCYILDNGANGAIYVWKGSTSEVSEKRLAMRSAMKFIRDKNYDNKTAIEVYPEGCESEMFLQFFA